LSPPRIVFAGSPEFAVPSLDALCASGFRPVAVLTQPDRPAGRGRKLTASPIKARALGLDLPVAQPATLKDAAGLAVLADLQPDLLVVVAYGLILPPAALAIPRRGAVNVHASLLPRFRGASPVEAAILAGDEATGVSIMALDAGLDTGPVYSTRRLPIGPDETAAALEQRLAMVGAEALLASLPAILAGTATPTPQSADGATYAGRIAKEAGRIDWSLPAVQLARQVRAYNPWPVAETLLDGQQLRCWEARPNGDPAAPVASTVPGSALPGTVLAAGPDGIDVQTGAGLLRLTSVQLAGRPRMPAGEFARGRPLPGRRFGPSASPPPWW
jgi:methionyl-tRNA formyltransferase